jgi:hypothetical protein
MTAEIARQQINDFVTAVPGNGIADGDRIPEYENILIQTRTFADKTAREIGVWTDEVRFRHAACGDILIRTQSANMHDEASWHQEIEVKRKTLTPHSVLIHSGEQLHNRVMYNGHVIHTTRRLWPEGDSEGGPVMVDLVLTPPEAVFEWQLWELTFAAFPLEVGFACRFLAHHVQINAASPLIRVSFVVTGEERIWSELDGWTDCWRIEALADNPWTAWIAKDRTQAPIVKVMIEYPGYTDTWARE